MQKQRMKIFHSATETNKMALKYVILISLGVYVLIHNIYSLSQMNVRVSIRFSILNADLVRLCIYFIKEKRKKRNIF